LASPLSFDPYSKEERSVGIVRYSVGIKLENLKIKIKIDYLFYLVAVLVLLHEENIRDIVILRGLSAQQNHQTLKKNKS
jgi:hypothetical protein